MDIILQTIFQYAAELIALILVSAIGLLGAWVLNKINKNKDLKNIEDATAMVIFATQETVRRLQQTLVDDYKQNSDIGKLTPEQIEILKDKTQQITMEQLAEPILELLAAVNVDVSSLITNAAESYINQIKNR